MNTKKVNNNTPNKGPLRDQNGRFCSKGEEDKKVKKKNNYSDLMIMRILNL